MNNTLFTSGSDFSLVSNELLNSFSSMESHDNSQSFITNRLKQTIAEQSFAIDILHKEISKLTEKIQNLENENYELKKEQDSKLRSLTQINPQEIKRVSTNSPKILIYGVIKQRKAELFDTLQNRLNTGYNIHIKKSDVVFLTDHDSDKLKHFSPVERLKSEKYDYLVVGPHPHSVKGKNSKHSWSTFLKNRGVKTEAFEEYNKPLSKDDILNIANKIGENNFQPELPKHEALKNAC